MKDMETNDATKAVDKVAKDGNVVAETRAENAEDAKIFDETKNKKDTAAAEEIKEKQDKALEE